MKTKFFTHAFIVLAGMVCLNVCTADAYGHSNRFSSKRYHSRRMHARSLADTKVKTIRFGYNNFNIPSTSYANLNNIAKLMKENNAALKVSGYADSKGGYVYNWKLSEKRAQAVKVYLADKGADSTRIAASGFGYTHPIASNKTPDGRARNRRAEIHFAQ
jgi:outer membrane protein OmpA-like peptidoglycan-associated protein